MSTRMVSRFEFSDKEFRYISRLVSDHAGIFLNEGKKELVYGRLTKRLRYLGLTSFREYCSLLDDGKAEEFTHCVNAITTNVTAFFRENHHFDYLTLNVFPEFVAGQVSRPKRKFRIWSAGCSSGEEPYSIAITGLEYKTAISADIEIVATDLDSEVIEKAKRGVFSAENINDFAVKNRKQWFQRGRGVNEGKIRINEAVRKLVAFKQLNLIEPWHIDGLFDVIFCRNVMIYFSKETREKILQGFFTRLQPRGYLFVGHSESLTGSSGLFESAGITIYRKKS